MKLRITSQLATACLLLMPCAALAQETPANEAAPADTSVAPASAGPDASKTDTAKDKKDKSWSVGADLGFDLGLGAFTKHEYARKIRSRFTFSVNGSYTIPVIDVDVHAETGFSQWMSKAGGSNGKYEFRWSDSTIGFSRNIWAYKTDDKLFGVSFDADLSFKLPTSTASINTNLYTTVAPSLSASIRFSRLSLTYQITYGYNAHEYTGITLDPSDVDVLSRSTGNELMGSHDIAVGGVLTEHELTNAFVLGIDCIRDMLKLSIGLGFADGWTYDNGTITADDEFVGVHAKVGRGHSQISQGIISLAYTPIQYATIALSMVSTQPWKTADNKAMRFPWFDTESPSKNYTKFILTASFNY